MNVARLRLGSIGRRMLLAFVLVAGSSVVVLTVAALIATGRGIEASRSAGRSDAAAAVATVAGQAYEAAHGWAAADLSRADAIAAAAGARLFVLDESRAPIGSGGGAGAGRGRGAGLAGVAGVHDAPVTVDGRTVGTVRLAFAAVAASGARDVAWAWIVAAAVVALLVALSVSWAVTRRLTRPIDAMTTAARAFTAGDRAARAGVTGPGELGELAHAFHVMADDVARSELERRNLTADVAHELRTPLAALQAGLEELRDGLVEPSPRELAGLHDQSLRLGRIVNDLAQLSAAEGRDVLGARSDVVLAELAHAQLAVHDSPLRAAGLVVTARLDERAVVWADADRLHQAVGNLLANAERYCRPGDRVCVVVSVVAGRAVLRVVDSGPGIPVDELPFVFDRLWRGRDARDVAGSGIGLAVARRIVTAHGGTIEAGAGESGEGTTVTISLPCSASGA